MTEKVRRMRELRESQGVSLRELANELNVNYSLVSYWESGKRNPSKGNIKKLESFFNKPIDYILEEDPHYTGTHRREN